MSSAPSNSRASARFASIGVGAPPTETFSTVRRTARGISPSASMSNTIPPMSVRSVTPKRSTASSVAPASNFSTSTAVAPTRRRQRRCDTSTGTWLSGLRHAPTVSARSPRAAAHARIAQRKFACVSMTPFGVPVVPDVYAMAARASAWDARAACAARRRARRRSRGASGRSPFTMNAGTPAAAAAARVTASRPSSHRIAAARA